MRIGNFLLTAILLAGVSGCDRQGQQGGNPPLDATDSILPSQASEPLPPATALPDPGSFPPMTTPVLTPEAAKGEKGARNVLIEWARAVERGDFDRAAAQWGERGTMSSAQHAERFAPLGKLSVSLGDGQVEGAAGSLFYEVPVTVSGLNGALSGEIVVRRVNDVPGASPAQLRWHIERLEITR
jgi:hypothetical protein